ncbi:Peptidase family M49 domain containing protein [Rhypophila sp. PSN 637]
MAVRRVQVLKLAVREQFDGLKDSEKQYDHHLARAAWYGARLILRQVSPESPAIFDFILELYHSCGGNWDVLLRSSTDQAVDTAGLHRFLTYAATFPSNVGNYYGHGDQKFVPDVSNEFLKKLASTTARASELYEHLGYPSSTTQSSYYLGEDITKDEIAIKKDENGHNLVVLLASVEKGDSKGNTGPRNFLLDGDRNGPVEVEKGDHSSDLQHICDELGQASKYTANETQKAVLKEYIASFQTGSLDSYRESQRIWVRDKAPRVENIFGFVEPYRDPHGLRAEFEGLVGIAYDRETELLSRLVEYSDRFICRLPWVAPFVGGPTDQLQNKGPFEKVPFEPPDFSSIHTLAYCSSGIFGGINLPNYNDIRQEHRFKNLIIANRMAAVNQAAADPSSCPFLDPSEAKTFIKHKNPTQYWWVVLHELLGHGTGRMMVENAYGRYNFDIADPPIHLVTSAPITSWYKPSQTWTGQFGDLATTVDECRAELVGAYLMDEADLLAILGFTETSDVTAADFRQYVMTPTMTYNLYQQLAIDGLRGLSNFNTEGGGMWGQAHSRAHFAILKCLLREGDGVVRIIHDKQMLLRLHMYRCTADVEGCRGYYEDLFRVDGEYLEWRETVLAKHPPPWAFVQANTFLDERTGSVTLKEYDATVEGVIQSWAERKV